MANLTTEFEDLGFWETTTEEDDIVIYGMDFPDTDSYILITDDAGKTVTTHGKVIVVACYDEKECFLWGKEIRDFDALTELVEEFKPETQELLEKIQEYKLPREELNF